MPLRLHAATRQCGLRFRRATAVGAAALVLAPAAAHGRSFDFTAQRPSERQVAALVGKLEGRQTHVRVFVTLRTTWTAGSAGTAATRGRLAGLRANALRGLGRASVRVRRTFDDDLPVFSADVDAVALRALQRSPAVAAIKEVRVHEPADTRSNITQAVTPAQRIGANATGHGTNQSGWTVAVIDTGVQQAHPYFQGRVWPGACFASNQYFWETDGECAGGESFAASNNDGAPCTWHASCWHGTHVAGIVAGKEPFHGNGVATNARILPIMAATRNCDIDGTNCTLGLSDDDTTAAMKWIADQSRYAPIAAVNLSYGSGAFNGDCGGEVDATDTAVALLDQRHVAVVAASGNQGYTNAINHPACVPGVVSVGSVDKDDVVAGDSNDSLYLDLMAVGDGVVSSVPGSKYASARGTSMAAPQVAGAFAVLRSLRPDEANPAVLLGAMQEWGDLVQDWRTDRPRKRLNLFQAIRNLWAQAKITAPLDTHPIMPSVDSDFDKDAVKDLVVWRPSTGYWDVRSGATKALLKSVRFGEAGDVPVPADYDGDKITDIAIFRPRLREWHIIGSQTGPQKPVWFGEPTDVPVPADYTGDGKADIAVFRRRTGLYSGGPASWYYKPSGGGADVGPIEFGSSLDMPVPGVWDTNKRATMATVSPWTGRWQYRRVSAMHSSAVAFAFGELRDTFLPGDFDGDGRTDAALYRPREKNWYTRNTATGATPLPTPFGEPNDVMVPGNYHSDADLEVGLWRLTATGANGTWHWAWPAGSYLWGASDAMPLR